MYNLGIVIPTYNEKDNIINLLSLVVDNLEQKDMKTFVLIMDDNSPDGTKDLVANFIENNTFKNIKFELKVREGKQGLATAYTQGFEYLINNQKADVVMSLDADLSHNPKYIYPMYELLIKTNKDLIVGSRYIEGGGIENWGPQRKFISKAGSLYAKTILGSPINDLTGGFNLYRSRVFDIVKLESINARGYLFQIEMKHRMVAAGFKELEYPIIFSDRVNGQSKMTKSIIFEALTGVWKLKFDTVKKNKIDKSKK